MSDITAAQARDIYNNLELWIATILRAETNITDLLGKKGKIPSIEDGLRNDIRVYMDGEVPALAVFSDGSNDDDNESDGLQHEIVVLYQMIVWTVNHGGDLKPVKNKAQQITAEVEHFLRGQVNSSDELSQTIGGTANALIKMGTTVFETAFDEDDQVFRVVGRTNFEVQLDLDVSGL